MSDNLAARIEASTEGTCELSEAMLVALGWEFVEGTSDAWPGLRKAPDGTIHRRQPDPTRSVDDAISLVPEGREWMIYRRSGKILAEITVHDADDGEEWYYVGGPCGSAATPALSLSAALVRASAQIV